jgi:hypothetical protein
MDQAMSDALTKVVEHPQFRFLTHYFHHVDNSRFILPRWSAELCVNGTEVLKELPRTVSFESISLNQVLADCLAYLDRQEQPDEV